MNFFLFWERERRKCIISLLEIAFLISLIESGRNVDLGTKTQLQRDEFLYVDTSIVNVNGKCFYESMVLLVLPFSYPSKPFLLYRK